MIFESGHRESNPDFNHGKVVGYHYIMAASVFYRNLTDDPWGNRTPVLTLKGWHPTIRRTGHEAGNSRIELDVHPLGIPIKDKR